MLTWGSPSGSPQPDRHAERDQYGIPHRHTPRAHPLRGSASSDEDQGHSDAGSRRPYRWLLTADVAAIFALDGLNGCSVSMRLQGCADGANSLKVA